MVSIKSSIQLNNSILSIEITKDYILAVDNNYYIYFIKKDDFEVKKNLQITAKPKPLHVYSKASAVSTKGIFNVALFEQAKSFVITTAKEIKKKAVIDNHHKDLEVTTFTPNSMVMVTGGADGNVFLYDLKYMKTMGSLEIKPDFISSLNFSRDGSLLFSSAYDKTGTIFNIDTNKVVCDIKFPDVVEDAKFFGQNKKVFVVCRNGASIVFDIKKRSIESSKNIITHWPTRVVITENEDYALVSTRSKHLYAIKLDDNTKTIDVELEHDGITYLKFFETYLLVGYQTGKLDIINFSIKEEELAQKLKAKDYRAVKELFDKNVFLKTHPLAKKFDEAWPAVLEKVIQLISAKQIDKAIYLAEPFLDDEKRNDEFNFQMANEKQVITLMKYMEEKKYVEAFQLCDKFNYLKKLKSYQQLEKYWNAIFVKARQLLEENPQFNKQKAYDLLKPFMRIESKKEVADQMVRNAPVFIKAEELAKNKKFYSYYTLAEKYGFLKDTSLYEKITALGERLYGQVLQLEQIREFEKASQMLQTLSQFMPYKEQVKDLANAIKFKSTFINAVSEDNLVKAYHVLDQYEDIKILPEYEKLSRMFKTKQEEAKKKAYLGLPKETIIILDDYLSFPYTVSKAASIVKIAYINEIDKNASREKSVNWNATISAYMELFGRDGDLVYICGKIEAAKAILDNIDDKGNSEGYLNSDFKDSIIVDA
jgi:hypothetical protein